MSPRSVDPESAWEDLIDAHAQSHKESSSAAASPAQLTALLERVDALELDRERKLEVEEVIRNFRGYIADKRSELEALRRYRLAMFLVALFCLSFIAVFLFYELANGFETIGKVIKNELIIAAYVAASLAFILGLLLALLRGTFGAIRESETQTILPPQLQELVELMKKLN